MNMDSPTGYAQVTASSAAQTLLSSIPANTGTKAAIIVVEGQAIRYREDGVAPTATVGTLVFPGSSIELSNHERLVGFQFINDTTATGNAVLDINFYHA